MYSLKVEAIQRFTSTATAVEDLAAIQDGRLTEGLEKFLVDATGGEGKKKKKDVTLVVSEPKLAATITKSLKIPVVSDSSTQDLYRGIRQQLASLLGGVEQKDLNTMSLGLGHSLSRFKLKFSTDKVDTMVIQAIALLDDLDKEINIYSMRVKEWYGWHFPEMGKIIVDNLAYARVVKAMGFRTNAATTDFSMVLPEDLEATLKQAAELSMGTEISDTDMNHINDLCDQVISITEYRTQLSEYLRNRMQAIAPNLTALVGDLVGARLISHAGSLMNLAKFPASTVQILGAEKALFRALKTKHDTPKYGLIYHASLVGQAPQKLKGKMARMTSTKASLSIRLDALADAETKSEFGAGELGIAERIKLESRLRALEHRAGIVSNRTATSGASRQQPKFELTGSSSGYNAAEDNLLPTQPKAADGDVSMADGDISMAPEGETKEERRARKEAKKAAKAAKKLAEAAGAAVAAAGEVQEDVDEKKRKKEEKKKRRASEANGEDGEKKKKKKRHSEV